VCSRLLAGIVQRNLNSIEDETKDRLRVLACRMGAAIDRENALIDGLSQMTRSVDLVPDALSTVEIEAILAITVCGGNDDR
jgi:hypothetical protein